MDKLNLVTAGELVNGAPEVGATVGGLFPAGAVTAVHGKAADIGLFGLAFASKVAESGTVLLVTAEPHGLLVRHLEEVNAPASMLISQGGVNLNYRANCAELKNVVELYGVQLVIIDCRHFDFGFDVPTVSVLKENLSLLGVTVLVLHSEKLFALSSLAGETYELRKEGERFVLTGIDGDKEFAP